MAYTTKQQAAEQYQRDLDALGSEYSTGMQRLQGRADAPGDYAAVGSIVKTAGATVGAAIHPVVRMLMEIGGDVISAAGTTAEEGFLAPEQAEALKLTASLARMAAPVVKKEGWPDTPGVATSTESPLDDVFEEPSGTATRAPRR